MRPLGNKRQAKPGGGRKSCGSDGGDGEALRLEGPATALAESPFIEATVVKKEEEETTATARKGRRKWRRRREPRRGERTTEWSKL